MHLSSAFLKYFLFRVIRPLVSFVINLFLNRQSDLSSDRGRVNSRCAAPGAGWRLNINAPGDLARRFRPSLTFLVSLFY
jgi:hypothetical protein